jgi:glucose dehydrogenase
LCSGALATAGNVVFYGTLEGYLKAVNAETGDELFKFKTPSGIIGNVVTYEHNGRHMSRCFLESAALPV